MPVAARRALPAMLSLGFTDRLHRFETTGLDLRHGQTGDSAVGSISSITAPRSPLRQDRLVRGRDRPHSAEATYPIAALKNSIKPPNSLKASIPQSDWQRQGCYALKNTALAVGV